MIEIKLNVGHFEELINKGYNLDVIFILKLLSETDEAYPSGAKFNSLIQTMQRKGLLSDKEEITKEGGKLLGFLSSKEEHPKIPRKKKIVVDDAFKQWWQAYPSTDTFEYKGKKFKGTRALRVKKDDCKAKIDKILAMGEYTIEEMVKALKLEISQKAENSIKTGQNKMSYFQNSLTYLNQYTYEAYIELIRAGHKPVEEERKQEFDGVNI